MSVKTVIDTDSLGLPDSDSYGVNCYVSEKGIQGTPAPVTLLASAGDYICSFVNNWKTYYVFSSVILDETLSSPPALWYDSGNPSGAPSMPPDFWPANDIDGDGLRRNIKTVSYMTLADKAFELSIPANDPSNPSILSFTAQYNSLTVFNKNIFAFTDETLGLCFVKDSELVFDTLTDLPASEGGSFFIRKYLLLVNAANYAAQGTTQSGAPAMPASFGARPMPLVNLMALMQKPGTDMNDFDQLTMTSSYCISLYQKAEDDYLFFNAGASSYTLAPVNISQHDTSPVRMRNPDSFGNAVVAAAGTPSKSLNSWNLVAELNLAVDSETRTIKFGFIQDYKTPGLQVGCVQGSWAAPANYIVTDPSTQNPISGTGPYAHAFVDALQCNGTILDSNSANIADYSYVIQGLPFPPVQAAPGNFAQFADSQGQQKILQWTPSPSYSFGGWTVIQEGIGWTASPAFTISVGDSIDAVDSNISQWLADCRQKYVFEANALQANFMAVYKEDYVYAGLTQARAKGHEQFALVNQLFILPSSLLLKTSVDWDSQDIQGRNFNITARVFQSSNYPAWQPNANVSSTGGNPEAENTLLGTSNRTFTQTSGGVPTDYEVTEADVRLAYSLQALQRPTNANFELPFDMLTKLQFQGQSLFSLAFPRFTQWVDSGMDANSVYYTRPSRLALDMVSGNYIIPSNIADKNIGLWGKDRILSVIGTKSIERYQIASEASNNVHWLDLASKWDQIVDWSGLGARGDNPNFIYKKHSDYFANDVNFVRKNGLDDLSFLAEETAIKGIRFMAIKRANGETVLLDSKNRWFVQQPGSCWRALTFKGYANIYADDSGSIWLCDPEELRMPYTVAWISRTPMNHSVGEIAIAYDDYLGSDVERMVELLRNGSAVRSRMTTNELVKFYSLGRGGSDLLAIRTSISGYLRQVSVTDTEKLQQST